MPLACRFFVQRNLPLIWTSARISDDGERPLYAHTSVGVRNGKTRDVRALGWRPDSVVLRLQFQFLVVYKEPKHVVPMEGALECNFYISPDFSGMDQNWGEAPHDQGIGLY